MYFFTVSDYYKSCYFGKLAQSAGTACPEGYSGVICHPDDIHFLQTEVVANATTSAHVRAIQDYLFSTRCANDTACSTQDQTVISNYMTAYQNFLIQQKIFFNAYADFNLWGVNQAWPPPFQPGSYPAPLTGVHNITFTLYPINPNNSPTPSSTSVTVPVDFGNGQLTLAGLEAYKQSFQNFNCEMQKILSYFTGMNFDKSTLLTNHYQITNADL